MWADISSWRSSTRLLIYLLRDIWTINWSQTLLVSSIVVLTCQCFLCDLTLHVIIRTICQFCSLFTSNSCSGCVYFENFSRFILIFKNSNLISLLIINSLFTNNQYITAYLLLGGTPAVILDFLWWEEVTEVRFLMSELLL